jgi:hypothetical protein
MRVPSNSSRCKTPRFAQNHWLHLCANMKSVVGVSSVHFRRWAVQNGVFAAALIIPLMLGYGAALAAHMKRSSNPLIFNDDVRSLIFPFFQFHEPGLFPHDYFGAYYLGCSLPLGYSAFYKFGAMLADPACISKGLPYFLFALTVIAVALAARRLVGYLGALVAAALVLSQGIFLDGMVGGLPRAFAFPALALTAVVLVYGRPRLLAGIVCGSAGFYPVAGILGGIALVLWLFVLPASDRGQAAAWALGRRVRLVIVTASISGLILLPMVLGARPYGRRLGPRDVTLYPEIGRGGRTREAAVPPFDTFPEAALEVARGFFKPDGKAWLQNIRDWGNNRDGTGANSNGDFILKLVAGLLLIGGVLVAARSSSGCRLLLLGAAAWCGHLLARWLAPYFYFPERYAMYAVPILLVVLIPAAGAAIGAQLSGRRFSALGQRIGLIAMAAMVLLLFGGRSSIDVGLNTDVTSQHGLYGFLGKLPKDALIAGWPTDVDSVPYVSRRQVLISYELHLIWHQGSADEMRRRMRALIDAYFATDPRALVRLRDEFGVTHLIFQQSRLAEPPTYFRPFSVWARKAFNDGVGKGFEIPRQINRAMVFSDGPFIVLDLRRLSTQ